MKILVTGGAGYIGSILVPSLILNDHEVTVLDNFMYNQTSLLCNCHSSKFSIKRYTVCNHSIWLKEFYKEFDIIIPLACLTGAPICKERYFEAEWTIVESIKLMLDSIPKDTKIIYPNTNSGYGLGGEELCTEESSLNPISSYGKLKCEAENLIMQNCNSITFRLATVFGLSERMRLDLLVNDFVYRAVNDSYITLFEGHFRRNYIHVTDVARAFLHAIENWDSMKNNIYNVGLSSANLTKRELAEKIKEYVPDIEILEGKFREDKDKRDYIVSNEKIEKTGWKPQVSLDEGIQELIKGYQILKRNQYANI